MNFFYLYTLCFIYIHVYSYFYPYFLILKFIEEFVFQILFLLKIVFLYADTAELNFSLKL